MTPEQQKFFAALPPSWQPYLQEICSNPKINDLILFLKEREAAGARIYPAKQNIFTALKETAFDKVKVVIVGQDPYHGPGQAHGLSFSVPHGVQQPPSLRNIFKELRTDIDMPIPQSGNLTGWAKQGVLLLNAILTVEEGQPASHANRGWELFTDAIIEQLIQSNRPMVFLLWGAYAQKKVQHLHMHINSQTQLVLKSAHPSPLSVTRFLGCRHFSQTNDFLKQNHIVPIEWQRID